MEQQRRPEFTTVLCLILFVISIGYFAIWGYEWINYLLSKSFDVQTDKTIFDLFAGLVAMLSSIPVFIGTVFAWRMKPFNTKLMIVGPIGFMVKNLFDIVNDIIPLTKMETIAPVHISNTTQAIGADIFHIAFWAFVMAFFARKTFARFLLSKFSSQKPNNVTSFSNER